MASAAVCIEHEARQERERQGECCPMHGAQGTAGAWAVSRALRRGERVSRRTKTAMCTKPEMRQARELRGERCLCTEHKA
jgi:hypothetical protein